jgi:hypothetical protein
MDNMFYVFAAAFAASAGLGIYSVRRWLDLRNAPAAEEELQADPAVTEKLTALPEAGRTEEEDMVAPDEPPQEQAAPAQETVLQEDPSARNVEELLSLAAAEAADKTLPPAQAKQPAPHCAAARMPAALTPPPSQAVDFVKGIYRNMAGINARIGAIEESLAKGPGGSHFSVKFLEGLLEDLDSMEKDKVRTRIEYLLSDLKAESGKEGKI